MAKPPKLTFRHADPLQDRYSDRYGNEYSVARLQDDAKNLPIFDAPLALLPVADIIWAGSTIYDLGFHVKKCIDADLSCPILIDWNGDIADGRHRVIMALAKGMRSLPARRITWKPDPCRVAPKE